MKIKSLKVRAFRGVRHELELDLTREHKNVAIYGENGTGKSTITDSIEWFLTNRVGHLWAEDCKDDAIRNFFADSGPCCVAVEFSEESIKSQKSLTNDSKIVHSNKSKAFGDYVAQASKERIFLRHADVSEFVTATKSQKREEIEKIIGYEAIKKFREVIRQTKSKLESSAEYQTSKRIVEQCSAEMVRLTQSTIAKEPHFFEFTAQRLAPHEIKTAVNSFSSLEKALGELKSQVGDTTKAEQKLVIQTLKSNVEKFKSKYTEYAEHRNQFLDAYTEILSDTKFQGSIVVGEFLNKGVEVLDSCWKNTNTCPFCLDDYDHDLLHSEVEKRVIEIASLSEKFASVKTIRTSLLSLISDLNRICAEIALTDSPGFDPATRKLLMEIEKGLAETLLQQQKSFESFKPISFQEACFIALGGMNENADKLIASAEAMIAKLTFSQVESEKIDLLQLINDARKAFLERQRNKKVVTSYQTQILTLGDVYDRFLAAQNNALQSVLNAISADVDRFFTMLHPNSVIKGIQLKILGEQGIEFEYKFHGRSTHPPKKYLSESFLNSLGLSLFFASAKLFNEQSRFLVLDDIVTSFDQTLRRRLIRLLKAEFADWQLILLTHEEFLFQLMRREFQQQSWNFYQVRFDTDNGTHIQKTAASHEQFILEKRKTHDVSNDLRKYLEQCLKEICSNVEAKVPFRFNGRNEQRMSDELLSALRRSIKEHKCTEVLNEDIFSKLDGSVLVTNRASHDSSDSINEGDIDVALGDINTLRTLFECDKCKRYVNVENVVPGEKKISCKCGNKKLTWVD